VLLAVGVTGSDAVNPLPPWAVVVFFVAVVLTFLALGILAATRGLT